MSYGYIGQPYSHEDEAVRHNRYEFALAFVAAKTRAGEIVYSPIVHFHNAAMEHNLPEGGAIWRPVNRAMLLAANRLIVLALPGWSCSPGLEFEMKLARENRIPIKYVIPDHKMQTQLGVEIIRFD